MSKGRKVRFVAHEWDEMGVKALRILEEAGCEVARLKGDTGALSTDVVFLFLESGVEKGKRLRIPTYDLKNVPVWACNSLFLVVVCDPSSRDFQEAVLEAARMYESWFYGGFEGAPWGQDPQNPDKLELFMYWKREVELVVQNLEGQPFWKTPGLNQKSRESQRPSWRGSMQTAVCGWQSSS